MNLVKLQVIKLIHINLLHFYTNNERLEREIQEANKLTIESKRIKYLGLNLIKETKELYSENYKILMMAIEEYINRWKDIPCS